MTLQTIEFLKAQFFFVRLRICLKDDQFEPISEILFSGFLINLDSSVLYLGV